MVGVVKSFPGGIEAVNYLSRDYRWVGPILNPWHIWEIRTSWPLALGDNLDEHILDILLDKVVENFHDFISWCFQKSRNTAIKHVRGGVMIQFYRWTLSFPPLAEPQNPRAVRLVNKLIGSTRHDSCLNSRQFLARMTTLAARGTNWRFDFFSICC